MQNSIWKSIYLNLQMLFGICKQYKIMLHRNGLVLTESQIFEKYCTEPQDTQDDLILEKGLLFFLSDFSSPMGVYTLDFCEHLF